jgi:hypothetical protein
MFDSLKSLFAKSTPPEFRDPDLGSLKLDRGVWGGSVQRDGRELRFWLAGTETTPDPGLLGRARSLLTRFADTERCVTEFLRSREAELRQARLDFYAFEYLWEDKPDNFAFEFLADGDDSRIWRVEFVAGQPSQSGYDD